LYTEGEEFALDLQRPCILNGIDDIASRPDLSERTITLQLEPIKTRREERALWLEFDQLKPYIFGAICDALSAGLRYADKVKLDNPPRMADAATWITACEYADGWMTGAFVQAFHRNQKEAVAVSLEASPVTAALVGMMASRTTWSGTATALLNDLSDRVDDDTRRSKAWPKSGDWLTKTLRRFGKPLRSVGIDIDLDRSAETRLIRIDCCARSESSRHSRHGVTDDDAMTPVTPDSGPCTACSGEGCVWCHQTGRSDQ
jgi:hypothetical protein